MGLETWPTIPQDGIKNAQASSRLAVHSSAITHGPACRPSIKLPIPPGAPPDRLGFSIFQREMQLDCMFRHPVGTGPNRLGRSSGSFRCSFKGNVALLFLDRVPGYHTRDREAVIDWWVRFSAWGFSVPGCWVLEPVPDPAPFAPSQDKV